MTNTKNASSASCANQNTASSPSMSLGSFDIRQDAEGRYCLNDLQKAATIGDARSSRTLEINEYMRRPETAALIRELENTGKSRNKAVCTIRGRNGGTYVSKELVYAYAMWISPQLHLEVIRKFDEVQTYGIAVSDKVKEVHIEDLTIAAVQAVERAGGQVHAEEQEARAEALSSMKGGAPNASQKLNAKLRRNRANLTWKDIADGA
ncbi:KilA-N domain-containing protein [Chromobacterium haemolyticum]|uniref:KilA-N domain-containing protein n=1 Tax=Chromobacterium haemolyticum TaxID=394935 RepID=UPI0006950158|nr:KilA-N domain-containing protein [Chromobacterium haemolyticum]